MNKTVAWLTTLFILVLGIALSFGQDVSEEARRHFDRGVAALEMAQSPADCEAAINEFEQAVKLAPDWPDVFYNLGIAQEKAEKYGDAVRSYQQYLRLAPNSSDAEEVKSLINKLEYRREKAEKERMDPNGLVGIWAPDEENGGAFYRFEIRNNNGVVEGGLRMYAFTEELGLGRRPWFVPIQWDGMLLVISHTRYFYCDKSVQMDCCPADASLSLTMIAKDTLKGTLRILWYKDHGGDVFPENVEERVWKRVK
jgi:hypothetical protein